MPSMTLIVAMSLLEIERMHEVLLLGPLDFYEECDKLKDKVYIHSQTTIQLIIFLKLLIVTMPNSNYQNIINIP
jgi:hypothetical protein